MDVKNYRDLLVWQKAMDLAQAIYINIACGLLAETETQRMLSEKLTFVARDKTEELIM